MNVNYGLPAIICGVTVAIMVQPQIAVAAKSANEINTLAKQTTVLLDGQNNGSGVIIKKAGDTYYVLTSEHVVATEDEYTVVTPDSKRYPIAYRTVRKLPGVDLAILQFTSTQNYTVAQLGDSSQTSKNTSIYIAGFPNPSKSYKFTKGKLVANASRAAGRGYTLVYDNQTSVGMSGSAILDSEGKVIGIHGQADAIADSEDPTKLIRTGLKLGIPINTFLTLLPQTGLALGFRTPALVANRAPTIDDFIAQIVEKEKQGDYQGMLVAANQAIRISPNNASAYYYRGLSHSILAQLPLGAERENFQLAYEDFNKAIQLDPNYSLAYGGRGLAFFRLAVKGGTIDDEDGRRTHQDMDKAISLDPNNLKNFLMRGQIRLQFRELQGVIQDMNQVLTMDKDNSVAYNNRGLAKSYLSDYQGAIDDYNQTLQIKPNPITYFNRGLAKERLKDFEGALSDYNQAIQMDSNNPDPYAGRASAKQNLGDQQGALEDYSQALRLIPNESTAVNNRRRSTIYSNRSYLKYKAGDEQGALEDLNQAIRIFPDNALSYYNRAFSHYTLGNKQRAIADLQQAAKLYQQQGDSNGYQKAINQMREFR